MTSKYKVGLIVGCGLDTMDIIKNRVERPVTTIFGDPSEVLIEGTIEGMECAVMSRDGHSSDIPPNMINHRANIWALKEAGCTHVLDMSSAGSLREELKPGDFLIPDSFIDLTNSRKHTFYDGEPGSLPGILLCPMNTSFCEPLRKSVLEAAQNANIECQDGGVGVTINGPRFSTNAESKMYRILGGDFVNMVLSSEAILSKEAGMLYACIIFIADYDTWKEGVKVNQKLIKKLKAANHDKIVKLLATCVRQIGSRDWDKEIEDLKKELSHGVSKCGCKK